ATNSTSAPRSLAARKKLRPMRPNPLTPILTVMERPPSRTVEVSMVATGRSGRPATGAVGRGPVGSGGSGTVEVSVRQRDGQAVVAEVRGERLRRDHRAMTPARAPHGD